MGWALALWCAVYLEISRQAGNDALAPATFAPAWTSAGAGKGQWGAESADSTYNSASSMQVFDCTTIALARVYVADMGKTFKSLEVPCHKR